MSYMSYMSEAQDTLKPLFGPINNLYRATCDESIPASVQEGLKLILDGMLNVLKDNDLEILAPSTFSPKTCDAIESRPSHVVPKGQIMQVLELGFRSGNGYTNIPAKVVVSEGMSVSLIGEAMHEFIYNNMRGIAETLATYWDAPQTHEAVLKALNHMLDGKYYRKAEDLIMLLHGPSKQVRLSFPRSHTSEIVRLAKQAHEGQDVNLYKTIWRYMMAGGVNIESLMSIIRDG